MARLPRAASVNRKEDVLRAATRVFAQRGFHGASMSAVAEEAGIQKASLYHWVESKEDLLFQVLRGALDHLIAEASAVTANPECGFADSLRKIVAIHVHFALANADVMRVFTSEAKWLSGRPAREIRNHRRRYFEVYEDLFINARNNGELAVAASEIPVYVNLLFTMTSQLPGWFRPDGAHSPNEVADMISGLILSSVLPGTVKTPS